MPAVKLNNEPLMQHITQQRKERSRSSSQDRPRLSTTETATKSESNGDIILTSESPLNDQPTATTTATTTTTTAATTTGKSSSPRQKTIVSTPILVKQLPSSSYLDQLGVQASKKAKRQHILTESLGTALETPLDAFPVPEPDKDHPQHALKDVNDPQKKDKGSTKRGVTKRYESWELLKAIEKKQIMTIYEIKSSQFDLLLETVGGSTPLVHAMRHGSSHRDVAVLITGALSKKVNDIADSEDTSPSTPTIKVMLRGIRTNLKLAIAHGLASEDTSLLASFLQVIVMSEGEKWLLKASHEIALACRAGPPGRPVQAASILLDKWVSRELQKSQIAAVSDYVANATGDLVLLGLWSVVTDTLTKEENVPLYYFARDDRVTKAMEERVETLKQNNSWAKLSPLLRRQIENALKELSKRTIGARERLEGLRKVLDE